MEKLVRTKTLSEAIDQIVRESIKAKLHNNAVEEKEKQTSLMGEEDPAGSEEKPADQEKVAPSKTADAEKDKLKKGEITPKDIVDKLNTIRSGKSFKDSAISSKMDEYINSLSTAEKTALLAFLKGLSQIVTGEVEANQAIDPSDTPAAVEMKKDSGAPEKKTIKPNVIKAPEKEKTQKTPSSEDTSGPVPITPKKK